MVGQAFGRLGSGNILSGLYLGNKKEFRISLLLSDIQPFDVFNELEIGRMHKNWLFLHLPLTGGKSF